MFTPKTNYAKIAFDTILFFVTTGQVKKDNKDKISDDLKLKMACIVSIYDTKDNLIGQFGGVNPQTDSLYTEILENAITAARGNDKFEPVKSDQLNQIKVLVDVLSSPHKVEDIKELKPHKHGLVIKKGKDYIGYVMPNIKGVRTVDKQIEILKSEYNVNDKEWKKMELYYFKSTRYN